MADISNESRQAIRSAIIDSVNKYAEETDFQIVTDIHISLNEDTGRLIFCDDADVEITSAEVSDWIDTDFNDYPEIIGILRNIMKELNAEKAFGNTTIAKPFTFVLEDEEHETIEELFFVDDDNIFFTTELLNGLDKDLDAFLSSLMED